MNCVRVIVMRTLQCVRPPLTNEMLGLDQIPNELEAYRALLGRELAHRAKNMLQNAASLLALQASRTSNLEARAILKGASERLIVSSEMNVALYRVSDGGDVPIRNYLEGLCRSMACLLPPDGRIVLVVAGENHALTHMVAMDIGMVVAEAVMNAVRHAFPGHRKGCITVRVVGAPEGFELSILDDGVGFDSVNVPSGLGTSILNAFARRLGGQLRIVTTPSGGTGIHLVVTDRQTG